MTVRFLKTWRRFHYVAFAAYAMGLWHGVMAGTDTQIPAVHWMYVLSAAAVAALLTFRVGEALRGWLRCLVRVESDVDLHLCGVVARHQGQVVARPDHGATLRMRIDSACAWRPS